jgi:protein phosphatase
MEITASGITDIGRKRDRNEDAFLINDELQLYVVADGMGGHAGGEYASALAVNTVEEIVTGMELPNEPEADVDPVDVIRGRLSEAVRLAGHRIFDWADEHPEFRGMGTTTVVLLLHQGNAFIAHVGDSRLYLVRDGGIRQVTDDHSLVAQSIREGLLTEEQARFHRMRNVITRALGFDRRVEVDLVVQAVVRGDTFVLCTDGLSGKVDDHEIRDIINAHDPQLAARHLVSAACARGGEDNISVVVVRVEST